MEIRKNQKIVLAGTVFDHGGYAYNNRRVFKGLHDLGWDMGLEAIPGTFEISPRETQFFNSFRKFNNQRPEVYSDPDAIKIFSHIPLVNVPEYKRNIIYTMTETRNPHPNFINWCNRFYHELWTPTEWNKRSFVENGLKIPARKVPIGIDEIYTTDSDTSLLNSLELEYHKYGDGPEKPEGYRFLSVFRWSYRKGFDLLVRSFLQEFDKEDGVHLLIHSRHAAMSHQPTFYNYVKNDLAELVKKYGRENSAPIYLCMDIVPMDLMPAFYKGANCFITCSRGEGLCIPALESAKMGVPIICPDHTGFSDYASEDRTFSFGVDEWRVCNSVPDWHKGGWITPMFFGQEFPFFGQEFDNVVQEQMRKVFSDPEEALRRANNLQKFIEENYSWSKIIKDIDIRLNEIVKENLTLH